MWSKDAVPVLERERRIEVGIIVNGPSLPHGSDFPLLPAAGVLVPGDSSDYHQSYDERNVDESTEE